MFSLRLPSYKIPFCGAYAIKFFNLFESLIPLKINLLFLFVKFHLLDCGLLKPNKLSIKVVLPVPESPLIIRISPEFREISLFFSDENQVNFLIELILSNF